MHCLVKHITYKTVHCGFYIIYILFRYVDDRSFLPYMYNIFDKLISKIAKNWLHSPIISIGERVKVVAELLID